MNFQDNKLEIGIGLLAAIMVTGMLKAFSGVGSHKAEEPEEISYEMPRPKSDLMGEFSLNDREIERREIALKAKEEAKTADTKKADEAKKAAALAAAKAAQAQAQNQQKKAGRVTVNVIPRSASGLSADGNGVSNPNPTPSAGNALIRQTANTDDNTNNAKDKDTKTAAEWKSLLDSQPTKANMAALVKAVQAGEIDEATFYAIVSEFINSKDATKTSVAFYGLQMDTTAQSFEFVAKEESTFPASAQATATQYLNSFTTANRRALVQELSNSDQDIALKAGQLIIAGIQNGTAQGGTTGNGGVQAQGAGSWNQYVTVFQHLATTSSDAALKTLMNGILGLLGAPATPAQTA